MIKSMNNSKVHSRMKLRLTKSQITNMLTTLWMKITTREYPHAAVIRARRDITHQIQVNHLLRKAKQQWMNLMIWSIQQRVKMSVTYKHTMTVKSRERQKVKSLHHLRQSLTTRNCSRRENSTTLSHCFLTIPRFDMGSISKSFSCLAFEVHASPTQQIMKRKRDETKCSNWITLKSIGRSRWAK